MIIRVLKPYSVYCLIMNKTLDEIEYMSEYIFKQSLN